MLVRMAVGADAETIAKNNVVLAQESETVSLQYKTVLAGVNAVLFDKNKGFYLVAEEDHNVIGQVMITFEWSDWQNQTMWWLQSVYIDPKWRKKGVFTTLFNDIKKQASRENIKILRLYVNTENKKAIHAYRHLGMEKKSSYIYQLLVSP